MAGPPNLAATPEERALIDMCKCQSETEGLVVKVRALMGKPGLRIDCCDIEGLTPLMHAAFRGRLTVCDTLIQNGADVNLKASDSGYTSIMFAAMTGHIPVVQFLLNAGASIDVANHRGKTLIEVSAFVGQHGCVRLLRNFIPFNSLKYYSIPQGLETEPKLSPALVKPLHEVMTTLRVHPVTVVLVLRDTHQMLVENSAQVCRILDIFCKKMTVDQNEMLSLKFHFLSYLITQCAKETCDSLLKRFLFRNYEGQQFELEVFLRHCLRAYPCKMQILLRELTNVLSKTTPGVEPTAVSLFRAMFLGNRLLEDENEEESCSTCGEKLKSLQKCSKCKKVWYCNANCQRIDWTVGNHKKLCKKWAQEVLPSRNSEGEKDTVKKAEDKEVKQPEATETRGAKDDSGVRRRRKKK